MKVELVVWKISGYFIIEFPLFMFLCHTNVTYGLYYSRAAVWWSALSNWQSLESPGRKASRYACGDCFDYINWDRKNCPLWETPFPRWDPVLKWKRDLRGHMPVISISAYWLDATWEVIPYCSHCDFSITTQFNFKLWAQINPSFFIAFVRAFITTEEKSDKN